jgi:hypothetical protein
MSETRKLHKGSIRSLGTSEVIRVQQELDYTSQSSPVSPRSPPKAVTDITIRLKDQDYKIEVCKDSDADEIVGEFVREHDLEQYTAALTEQIQAKIDEM